MDDEVLFRKAVEVMKHSYCPYSKFPVGAALLTDDGEVFVGVNIENASYPAGICAEGSAIANAISHGKRTFKKIAIATELKTAASPCGVCRQRLSEFGNFEVHSYHFRAMQVILGSSTSDDRMKTTTQVTI